MEPAEAKKYHVVSTTLGCITNLVESSTLRRSFNKDGFKNVDNPAEADVVMVNTCGYNVGAEDYSLNVISDLKKKYPDKKVVVGGCLPGINEERLKEVHSGEILKIGEWDKLNKIVGPDSVDTSRLAADANTIDDADLDQRAANKFLVALTPVYDAMCRLFGRRFHPIHNVLQSHSYDKKSFLIYVSRGCLGSCTYCGIWHAKGRLNSKTLEEIMREFRAGLDRGFKTFHLIADDVGCWGQDLGTDSANLLKEMLGVDADFQIAIYYFDPTWLMKLYAKLREPMSDPRIIFVNFPIQSGSTPLVQKMDRHYTVEGALSRIAAIKASNPDMVMKTHLMCGYPEETDEDFERSLWTMQFFDVVLVNMYGPRPNTKAAENPNQVPERVKKIRHARMRSAMFTRHAAVFLKSFLNPKPIPPARRPRPSGQAGPALVAPVALQTESAK